MRIVVTGGTGLAGRYVVAELLRASHNVTVIARHQADVPAGARLVTGDVRRLEDLVSACAGAEAVAHLAAVPRPGLVPDEELFRTNVLGWYNVHEAAVRAGVRRVVSCTSTAVLGWDWGPRDVPPAYLPIDEDHPLRPADAYGLSKECAESIARSYHRRHGLETPVLRPPWIASPADLAGIRRQGGRRYEGFHHYAYIDARDLAVAFRLALERPGLDHVILWVAADDSSCGEPLTQVLPRALPAVGEMAANLHGFQSAISSQRAKQVLGWRPVHTWRTVDSGG